MTRKFSTLLLAFAAIANVLPSAAFASGGHGSHRHAHHGNNHQRHNHPGHGHQGHTQHGHGHQGHTQHGHGHQGHGHHPSPYPDSNHYPQLRLLGFQGRNFYGRGVFVTSVSPGSRAEMMGLSRNDVVTSLNGMRVRNLSDYHHALSNSGGFVELGIERSGMYLTLSESAPCANCGSNRT